MNITSNITINIKPSTSYMLIYVDHICHYFSMLLGDSTTPEWWLCLYSSSPWPIIICPMKSKWSIRHFQTHPNVCIVHIHTHIQYVLITHIIIYIYINYIIYILRYLMLRIPPHCLLTKPTSQPNSNRFPPGPQHFFRSPSDWILQLRQKASKAAV